MYKGFHVSNMLPDCILCATLQRLADDRQQQLGEAMAALKATQAALHEKTQQV
jgi:hypothetical protein